MYNTMQSDLSYNCIITINSFLIFVCVKEINRIQQKKPTHVGSNSVKKHISLRNYKMLVYKKRLMNVFYTTVYRIFTDSNIVPEHKTRNVTVWYTSTVKSMSFVGHSFLWIVLVCLSINLNVDVREFQEMNMCL